MVPASAKDAASAGSEGAAGGAKEQPSEIRATPDGRSARGLLQAVDGAVPGTVERQSAAIMTTERTQAAVRGAEGLTNSPEQLLAGTIVADVSEVPSRPATAATLALGAAPTSDAVLAIPSESAIAAESGTAAVAAKSATPAGAPLTDAGSAALTGATAAEAKVSGSHSFASAGDPGQQPAVGDALLGMLRRRVAEPGVTSSSGLNTGTAVATPNNVRKPVGDSILPGVVSESGVRLPWWAARLVAVPPVAATTSAGVPQGSVSTADALGSSAALVGEAEETQATASVVQASGTHPGEQIIDVNDGITNPMANWMVKDRMGAVQATESEGIVAGALMGEEKTSLHSDDVVVDDRVQEAGDGVPRLVRPGVGRVTDEGNPAIPTAPARHTDVPGAGIRNGLIDPQARSSSDGSEMEIPGSAIEMSGGGVSGSARQGAAGSVDGVSTASSADMMLVVGADTVPTDAVRTDAVGGYAALTHVSRAHLLAADAAHTDPQPAVPTGQPLSRERAGHDRIGDGQDTRQVGQLSPGVSDPGAQTQGERGQGDGTAQGEGLGGRRNGTERSSAEPVPAPTVTHATAEGDEGLAPQEPGAPSTEGQLRESQLSNAKADVSHTGSGDTDRPNKTAAAPSRFVDAGRPAQMVERAKVEVSGTGRGGHVQLDLRPEHLGGLRLQLHVEDGTLAARFVAESESALRAIEGGLPDLKVVLEQRGLNVETLSVELAKSGSGFAGSFGGGAEGYQEAYGTPVRPPTAYGNTQGSNRSDAPSPASTGGAIGPGRLDVWA